MEKEIEVELLLCIFNIVGTKTHVALSKIRVRFLGMAHEY